MEIIIGIFFLYLIFKLSRKANKREQQGFMATAPVISGWSNGYELKRMERKRDHWVAHYGKKGYPGTVGSIKITRNVTGSCTHGMTLHINH